MRVEVDFKTPTGRYASRLTNTWIDVTISFVLHSPLSHFGRSRLDSQVSRAQSMTSTFRDL